MLKKHLILLFASLSFITSIGCGRSNSVYNDTTVTPDNLHVLPPGFYNQSVNQAIVEPKKSGSVANLRFKTLPVVNAAGSFNDNTKVGNFAILGANQFDQTALSTISHLAFETKQIKGTRPLTLLLQIDLACDGSTPYVIQATGTDLNQTTASNSYVSYSVLSNESVFTSHAAIQMGGADVIPETDSGNGTGSINDLVAAYPNACISNAKTYDPGFANDLPTAGVLLGLGDSDDVNGNEIVLRSFTVDSQIFSDWEQ